MAITKTNEKLLLLKGTRENLASMDIQPGAIYFTTDYPGIYVDLAAEGTQGSAGYQAPRRLRMGDITVVDNLAKLQSLVNLQANAASGMAGMNDAGEILSEKNAAAPILTDRGLYYAIAENVLCMYDKTNKRFVWINDHTQLQQLIAGVRSDLTTAQGELTSLKGVVSGHTQTIGSSGAASTNGKTLFKAIEDVAASLGATSGDASTSGKTAFEAIEALDTRIDAITDGSTDSIKSLKDAIAAEETARKAADAGLGGRIDGHDTAIGNIKTKMGFDSIPDGKNLYTLITSETATRSEEDQKLDKKISDEIKAREALAETVGNNKTAAEAAIKAEEDRAKAAEKVLTDSLGYTKPTDGKSLYELYSAEVTNRINKDNALDAKISAHNTRIGAVEGGLSTAQGDISNLQTALNNEITNRTNADTSIRTDFAKGDADTLAAAKQYAEEYVNTQLTAADAMSYKGTIEYKDGSTDLNYPTGVGENVEPIQAGDTYVVKADKANGIYHAGDLIIALEDQTDTTQPYPSNKWSHVKTGYDQTHEAKLNVDTVTANSNTAKIGLTSHVGTGLGSVTFTTDSNNNIQFTQSEGNNGSISINLVWATF